MAASRLNELLSGSPSQRTSSEILSLLHESRLHRPDIVLTHSDSALSHHSAITKQHWQILSQTTYAAAELGEREITKSCIQRILRRFPHSVRAFALLGVTQEVSNPDKAAATYNDVLRKQPLALPVWKRQIALLKSCKRLGEAAALTRYYLSFHADDFDAWAELCALSLRIGGHSHAAFAANEMLLLQPSNFAAHIVAADVYMTAGGTEAVLLARAHYATSLQLRKSPNLRALYGLWLACSVLLDSGVEHEERDKCSKLLAVAKEGIRSVYANPGAAAGGKLVENMLESNVVTGKKREKDVED